MTTPAAAFQQLPRVKLAQLPTPVEPMPNLSRYLGGPELWIKRDDQTGLATGGNKARKLEFLMAEALENGANTVVTAGSTQSNHARQTAAAAAKLGLECHLALYSANGSPPRSRLGNVLLDELLGATVHWTREQAPYQASLDEIYGQLAGEGKSPHIVPYGGSSRLGLMGYVGAMLEIAEQEPITGTIDAVAFASSSGGTQAGMILGAKLAGWLGRVRLLAISVDEPDESLRMKVGKLANEGAQLLGLDWQPATDTPEINDHYLGGGYAVVGDAEREAIKLIARHEGILVDPVYTGKALAGLIDLIRKKEFKTGQRVLFWHTGGYAALFAFADQLAV